MYSPSARRSYRGFSGAALAGLMAFDLHNQVPTYSPASVSAFLFEAVNSIADKNDPAAYPIAELARELIIPLDLAPSHHEPPVVSLGLEGFDKRIAQLWTHLWPAMRRSLAFRLSFSPQDLVEDVRPAIICTPQAFAARWSGFTLVEPNGADAPRSLAAALLVGAAAGWPLQAFGNDVEVEINSFGDLGLLERASELVRAPGDPPEQLIAAARLIEHLSPVSTAGAAGKVPLLERQIGRAHV